MAPLIEQCESVCVLVRFFPVLCKKEMFNVSSWGGGKKEPKVTQNFCYGFDFSYHTRSVQPEGQMPWQHPAAPVCPVDSAYHAQWCCHANPCTRTRHLPPEEGPLQKSLLWQWTLHQNRRFLIFFWCLSIHQLFPLKCGAVSTQFFSPVKSDPWSLDTSFTTANHGHRFRICCLAYSLYCQRQGHLFIDLDPTGVIRIHCVNQGAWTIELKWLYTKFPWFLDTAKL